MPFINEEITDLSEIKYLVDGEGPYTAKEFIKVNVCDDSVFTLDADALIQILSLKVGETYEPGMGADVKRIA